MSDTAVIQSSRRLSRRSFLIGSGVVLGAAALAACAPPGVNPQAPAAAAPAEGVTLTFTTGQHANFPFDTLMFQEWQKRTGVTIDWKLQPSPSVGDKVKLMLSSGDVTDIVIGPRSILRELGPEACLPLDDLIQQHMPNYSKVLETFVDEVPPTRSPDGKFYGIWARNENIYLAWMYRKDLADKLGFSKLATLDDWYNFMKAAKQDDPNTHGVGVYGDILTMAWSLRGAYGIHGQ